MSGAERGPGRVGVHRAEHARRASVCALRGPPAFPSRTSTHLPRAPHAGTQPHYLSRPTTFPAHSLCSVLTSLGLPSGSFAPPPDRRAPCSAGFPVSFAVFLGAMSFSDTGVCGEQGQLRQLLPGNASGTGAPPVSLLGRHRRALGLLGAPLRRKPRSVCLCSAGQRAVLTLRRGLPAILLRHLRCSRSHATRAERHRAAAGRN
eukprot:1119808-Rhodomonas_salina.5